MATWIEKEDRYVYELITGDGKKYNPHYFDPEMSLQLNTVQLEFNNVEGSLVRSGLYRARSFPMLLMFDGADHLDKHSQFIESCKHKGNWKLTHPYYGKIMCRPVNEIKVSHARGNITEIKVEVLETIGDIDRMWQRVYVVKELPTRKLSAKPDTAKLSAIKRASENFAKAKAATNEAIRDINRAASTADRIINSAGADTAALMFSLGYILRTPGRLYETAMTRINLMKEAYNHLRNAIIGVGNIENNARIATLGNKQTFEILGNYVMQGAIASIGISKAQAGFMQDVEAPEEEQMSLKERYAAVAGVMELADDYIKVMQQMQTDKDNMPESYYPDYATLSELLKEIYVAAAAMFARQEAAKILYRHIVESDTALIPLLYRLTGTTGVEALKSFVKINNMSVKELYVLERGREVMYER